MTPTIENGLNLKVAAYINKKGMSAVFHVYKNAKVAVFLLKSISKLLLLICKYVGACIYKEHTALCLYPTYNKIC